MTVACWINVSVFFFQAEDGIRDYKVTGVQTCALPICEKDQEDQDGVEQDEPPCVEAPLDRRHDHLVSPAGVDIRVILQGVGERVIPRPPLPGENVLARLEVEPDIGISDLTQRENGQQAEAQKKWNRVKGSARPPFRWHALGLSPSMRSGSGILPERRKGPSERSDLLALLR